MPRRPRWWEEGEYYDKSYLDDPHEQRNRSGTFVRKQVSFIRRQLRSGKKAKMLDLACGIGQVSIELARRGFQTTGTDLNRYFLAVCRRNARKAEVRVRFIRADMRDLPFESGAFDVVVCFNHSIGIFRDEAENRRAFGEAARVLRPGGKFLYETWSYPRPNNTRTRRKPYHWKEIRPDGTSQWVTGWWGGGRGHVRMRSKVRTITIDYKEYTTRELRRILRSLGFRTHPVIHIDYYNWRRVSSTRYARRRVMIATKQ